MNRVRYKHLRLMLLAGMSILLFSCTNTQDSRDIQKIVLESNQSFYLDERIWFQNIQAEISDNTIILKGEAFFSGPVRGIIRKLKKAGYQHDIVDSIKYLPEHFPNDLGYGIITEPYVMGRYQPVSQKQEGTEMLYGEPVRFIREVGDYIQLQSAIGYLGYIPKTTVRAVDISEWNRYQTGKQALFINTVNVDTEIDLKIGTRLPYLEDGRILLADGSQIQLEQSHYEIIDPASNPLRAKIILSAERYLGLPYVWGGRSGDGVDCSGFVMQAYALNGLYLPRDSDEIANVGRLIGLPGWTEAMLPGDLLFFMGSRRMITHTGIYLGNGKIIHSLGSGVQIQSIYPEDIDYAEKLAKRFIFAKRIFD